ncbi:hypothetical protein CN290_28605 [Bacillus cereus]|uniref:Uncharacterized protein n=1 Tax=Bacillus cereus TaxID=1396 RepID=A0A2A8XVL2_BACCE|nr:hypothetical protein CN290_28605 [Bacillus cereus]
MNKTLYSLKDYVNAIIWLLLPCAVIFASAYPTFFLYFILFLSILFSYYGFTMKSLINSLGLKLIIPVYRLLTFCLSIISFTTFMVIALNNKIAFFSILATKYTEELSYFLIMYIISTFLFFLFEIIFYIYKHIKDPKNIKENNDRLKFSLQLFIAIFTTLILPDIVFGALYIFTFSFYDATMSEKSLEEFSYFSFLIHFALPINSKSILDYVQFLNEHTLTRILQVVHIITCKFLDLTFLAILIQYFLGFINTFHIQNKNNKDS